MNPIATYTERLLEVRRQFSLYEDRVVVEARWLLKGRFETVVILSTLKAEPHDLTVRYRLYRYASWILGIGLLILAMTFYTAQGGPIGLLGNIAAGVALLGGAGLAASHPHRRIRFVRFDSVSGRPGLDIGHAGNDGRTFEAFVNQVKRQIRKQDRLASTM